MDRLHDTRELSTEDALLQAIARLDLVIVRRRRIRRALVLVCALASVLCTVYAYYRTTALGVAPGLYIVSAILSLIAVGWEWAAENERRALLARLPAPLQLALGGAE